MIPLPSGSLTIAIIVEGISSIIHASTMLSHTSLFRPHISLVSICVACCNMYFSNLPDKGDANDRFGFANNALSKSAEAVVAKKTVKTAIIIF